MPVHFRGLCVRSGLGRNDMHVVLGEGDGDAGLAEALQDAVPQIAFGLFHQEDVAAPKELFEIQRVVPEIDEAHLHGVRGIIGQHIGVVLGTTQQDLLHLPRVRTVGNAHLQAEACLQCIGSSSPRSR